MIQTKVKITSSDRTKGRNKKKHITSLEETFSNKKFGLITISYVNLKTI